MLLLDNPFSKTLSFPLRKSTLGLPHPSNFPFRSLSAEVTKLNPTTKTIKPTVIGAKSQTAVHLVTVPHEAQPGKAENLTDTLQVYGFVSLNFLLLHNPIRLMY